MSALYNQDTISQEIHTKWAGKTVHFVKETDSTNILAKTLAREGAPHGTLAVTEFQTAGRGRFDRRWSAPEGSSAMMTLLLRPEFEPQYASMLTLVMGLSVAQAVEKLNFRVQIKWPNDVVVSRKKICGILTEMGVQGNGISYVAIGVGINVNTKEFPEEIADKGTSLYLEGGQELDRSQVIGSVMERFEENYGRFIRTCDMTQLKEDYERLLANMGKPVRVLDSHKPYEGSCLGIDSQGELLVRCGDGRISRVRAGEVSVRGLYSYV
ncbi:MAG: biotin--[acetyl-CoA-carboxylase] ligase [Eubacteriales bacterium]|nr:biotin--[acetyl-CoA-carboxylase] ligase [Eubacteriales bacterium]